MASILYALVHEQKRGKVAMRIFGHIALIAAVVGCIATGAIAVVISMGQVDLVDPAAYIAVIAFGIATISTIARGTGEE